MRKIYALLAAAALAAPVLAAALNPGDVMYNSDLAGSGKAGDGGPYYTNGLPAWAVPANLHASLSSPIAGIPGFAAFTGTVESWCYNIPGGGVGLVYRINLAGNSASRLVRASISSVNWGGVGILDAGSDGSGTSSAVGSAVNWTDGDPYLIERSASPDENPQWSYRFGTNGTELNPGQSSALTWFATDAVNCSQSSISLLDGGAAGAAHILSVAPIPTPAAAGLGLLGLSLAGALRRRLA